jgi:hypothetical protein
MTAIATSHGADELGNVVALTEGYSATFLGAAAVAATGALLAALLLRVPKATDAQALDPASGEPVAA